LWEAASEPFKFLDPLPKAFHPVFFCLASHQFSSMNEAKVATSHTKMDLSLSKDHLKFATTLAANDIVWRILKRIH
jgi:hypothetical protein